MAKKGGITVPKKQPLQYPVKQSPAPKPPKKPVTR